MENFLKANGMVTWVLLTVALINTMFACEGQTALPEYMLNILIALAVEFVFWVIVGIIYLVWLWNERRDSRRLGILRYDGQRGEWYYQK